MNSYANHWSDPSRTGRLAVCVPDGRGEGGGGSLHYHQEKQYIEGLQECAHKYCFSMF